MNYFFLLTKNISRIPSQIWRKTRLWQQYLGGAGFWLRRIYYIRVQCLPLVCCSWPFKWLSFLTRLFSLFPWSWTFWRIPSPSNHNVLLKMISVDDALVSWVPRESVRYNVQQTTAKLTCNSSCPLSAFYSSRSLLSLIASYFLWHQRVIWRLLKINVLQHSPLMYTFEVC